MIDLAAYAKVFHPLANVFPLREEKIPALMESIKRFGLIHILWTIDGKLIDGRRRYIACERLDCTHLLRYKEFDGEEPTRFVMDLNADAIRQLTETERLAAAVKAEPFFAEDAKRRMLAGAKEDPHAGRHEGRRDALQEAAASFQVSHRSAARMKRVLKDASPETAAAVMRGEVNLTKAERALKKRDAAAYLNASGRKARAARKADALRGALDTSLKAVRKWTREGGRLDELDELAAPVSAERVAFVKKLRELFGAVESHLKAV